LPGAYGRREIDGFLNILSLITHTHDGWLKLIETKENNKQVCVTRTPVKWKAPGEENFKLNLDVAVSKEGTRGLGFIVRNSLGEIMLTGCKKLEVEWDV